MDRGAALRWSGFLLLALGGCQHQVMTMPNPGSVANADKTPAPERSQIKPAPAKAKDLPPQVWVSCGDFKTGEASAPDMQPERQQHIRELARADYEQALKIDRKYVPAYQGLARLYLAMQDAPQAIDIYQKALQIAPQNAALWYELGMCHNSQKNWGPALECLGRAEQLDPRNRSYANARAVVLAESGRYEESLSCFIRSSGEAMGHYRLAQTLQRLQQPEASRRYLETALQMDPSLAAVALHGGGNGPMNATPPVQQTAYHDATPPTETAPAPLPTPPMPPSEVAPPENPPAQEQVILPPPPPVNVQYDQPQ